MSLRSIFAVLVTASSLILPAAARAEVKLGYVDVQRALTEVEEGRAAKARLQKFADTKEKELNQEQESLRKEKELLDRQASAMSEETRTSKQTDLQKKLYELAQRMEKARLEMAQKERQELQTIVQKMDGVISLIAEREGFTMVFDKSAGLVYAPAHLDVTNDLVRLYNDKYKSGAKKEGAPKKDAAKK